MTDATNMSPEEIFQLFTDKILQELIPVAANFAAHFPQEKLGEVAAALAHEQMTIMEQVFPSMVDPNILAKQPSLIIEIKNLRTGQGGTFQVTKRQEFAGDDPGQALFHAFFLAFMLTPSARAILRMHGYTYRFMDPKPKDEPRIKLVRS